MEEATLWDNLKSTMEKESQFFDSFLLQEKNVKEALFSKDWVSLQQRLQEMLQNADKMTQFEQERTHYLEEIKKKKNLHKGVAFSTVLTLAPEKETPNLRTLFNDIRTNVLVSQTRLDGIKQYAELKMTLSKDLFKSMIPDNNEGFYTPSIAKKQEQETTGILLNTHS